MRATRSYRRRSQRLTTLRLAWAVEEARFQRVIKRVMETIQEMPYASTEDLLAEVRRKRRLSDEEKAEEMIRIFGRSD